MGDLAILLGTVSHATKVRVDSWLSWLAIGSCAVVLVLEWLLHLKGKVSLRRVLWESGACVFVIAVMATDLLRQ
jgi:hypothetical protein